MYKVPFPPLKGENRRKNERNLLKNKAYIHKCLFFVKKFKSYPQLSTAGICIMEEFSARFGNGRRLGYEYFERWRPAYCETDVFRT